MYITKVDLILQLKEHERRTKCPLLPSSHPIFISTSHSLFLSLVLSFEVLTYMPDSD